METELGQLVVVLFPRTNMVLEPMSPVLCKRLLKVAPTVTVFADSERTDDKRSVIRLWRYSVEGGNV